MPGGRYATFIEEGWKQKSRQRSSLLFRGQNWSNSNSNSNSMHVSYIILHQDDLKNGMNSPYSSYCPVAIHPIFHTVLVQFILLIKWPWCKIASAAKKWTDSAPQAAVTTFAFSSVLILLWTQRMNDKHGKFLGITNIGKKWWTVSRDTGKT